MYFHGSPLFRIYEFFQISRIVFRGLASRGPLMGIKKSSWWKVFLGRFRRDATVAKTGILVVGSIPSAECLQVRMLNACSKSRDKF